MSRQGWYILVCCDRIDVLGDCGGRCFLHRSRLAERERVSYILVSFLLFFPSLKLSLTETLPLLINFGFAVVTQWIHWLNLVVFCDCSSVFVRCSPLVSKLGYTLRYLRSLENLLTPRAVCPHWCPCDLCMGRLKSSSGDSRGL